MFNMSESLFPSDYTNVAYNNILDVINLQYLYNTEPLRTNLKELEVINIIIKTLGQDALAPVLT
jgi:hypothetical protein